MEILLIVHVRCDLHLKDLTPPCHSKEFLILLLYLHSIFATQIEKQEAHDLASESPDGQYHSVGIGFGLGSLLVLSLSSAE